ncbi:ABC transporter substrate-binding protein [Paenibacillus paeoniae]|uniref:ABC transporter substrate-binding protein n=1 Tax=Paenibacillus paeoniae TaxID=2292705 RepID=A0A371PHG7_9BACL|nr:ABC transporter substrate-binding protein [Paenibacillus paeoniae]REK75066.1 ABC transporter substrate-binding protein [Paenibacillus paeoniae]
MNKQKNRLTQPWKLMMLAAVAALALSACGNETNSVTKPSASPEVASNGGKAEVTENEGSAVRMFKDWGGHDVEVPNDPKRIVFHGETTGDLLALGIMPVGIMQASISGAVFEERMANVEDVGFPLNVEKAIELDADLIIVANNDEEQYQKLSKVAPTVTFDTFATLPERMATLGELLGKEKEAQEWLEKYKQQETEMWKSLRASGVSEDETASVITFYPGNRLFIMLAAGLPQLLYSEGGFKMTEPIKSSISEGVGFVEISMEKLPEFVGDRIFVLTPESEEAKGDTKALIDSALWKGLPAVKNGYVYELPINKASSDATSRQLLLDELPQLLMKP